MKRQETYSDALSHDARLLHAPRPAELLHVLAEVTLPALGPKARFTLAASRPPASRAGRGAIGRQLNGRRRPHLGLRPVGRPLLEDKPRERERYEEIQRLSPEKNKYVGREVETYCLLVSLSESDIKLIPDTCHNQTLHYMSFS